MVDKKIVDYIIGERAKGTSDDAIKTALRTAGHSEEIIAEGMRVVLTPMTAATPWMMYAMFTIVGLGAIVAVWYFVFAKQSLDEQAQSGNDLVQSKTPSANTTDTDECNGMISASKLGSVLGTSFKNPVTEFQGFPDVPGQTCFFVVSGQDYQYVLISYANKSNATEDEYASIEVMRQGYAKNEVGQGQSAVSLPSPAEAYIFTTVGMRQGVMFANNSVVQIISLTIPITDAQYSDICEIIKGNL